MRKFSIAHLCFEGLRQPDYVCVVTFCFRLKFVFVLLLNPQPVVAWIKWGKILFLQMTSQQTWRNFYFSFCIFFCCKALKMIFLHLFYLFFCNIWFYVCIKYIFSCVGHTKNGGFSESEEVKTTWIIIISKTQNSVLIYDSCSTCLKP